MSTYSEEEQDSYHANTAQTNFIIQAAQEYSCDVKKIGYAIRLIIRELKAQNNYYNLIKVYYRPSAMTYGFRSLEISCIKAVLDNLIKWDLLPIKDPQKPILILGLPYNALSLMRSSALTKGWFFIWSNNPHFFLWDKLYSQQALYSPTTKTNNGKIS